MPQQKKTNQGVSIDFLSLAKYWTLPVGFFVILGLILYAVSLRAQVTELGSKLGDATSKQDKFQDNIFRLGKNLWDKKHVYDVRIIIQEDGEDYEFYVHRQILIANSKWFEIQFTQNRDMKEFTFTDVTKDEFSSVLEIIYFGDFQSTPKLTMMPNIVRYLEKFMLLENKRNYLDQLFSKNGDFSEFYPIAAEVYPSCKKYGLWKTKEHILKHIYTSWRKQSFFNSTHVADHPEMFADYVVFLNC